LVLQNVFRKMEKGVGQSTRRLLSWHEGISEYLEGTTEELGVDHVRLTVILMLHKSVSPFPREFTKNVF
jgi:hypothetical protein